MRSFILTFGIFYWKIQFIRSKLILSASSSLIFKVTKRCVIVFILEKTHLSTVLSLNGFAELSGNFRQQASRSLNWWRLGFLIFHLLYWSEIILCWRLFHLSPFLLVYGRLCYPLGSSDVILVVSVSSCFLFRASRRSSRLSSVNLIRSFPFIVFAVHENICDRSQNFMIGIPTMIKSQVLISFRVGTQIKWVTMRVLLSLRDMSVSWIFLIWVEIPVEGSSTRSPIN